LTDVLHSSLELRREVREEEKEGGGELKAFQRLFKQRLLFF